MEGYVGILEPEAATNLEIVSVSRAHVSVKTSAGALIMLPHGHVKCAPASRYVVILSPECVFTSNAAGRTEATSTSTA
jgi:hypothetical protein